MKTQKLLNKILELGQELLIKEIIDDSLYICGVEFTNKLIGKYGRYETLNGEVILFQPNKKLFFTIVSGDLTISGNIDAIEHASFRLEDYNLFLEELQNV